MIRTLRSVTQATVNKEPKWRHLRAELTTGYHARTYPTIFNSADVALITKLDLSATEFDMTTARANIQAVRPGMRVFAVSAKTGEGLPELLDFVASKSAESRHAAATG